MFKKLLLATIIVMIGLWGAGYDFASVKDNLKGAANKSASATTGRSDNDWGAGT